MPKILFSHSHWGPKNSSIRGRGIESKKYKRVDMDLPREAGPAIEEELEIEERGGGGVEYYPEPPVLSSNLEETLPAQNRAEIGKNKVEE